MTTVRVASLRRYPVKSMGGEPMTQGRIDRRGLVGDRAYAVVDADGKLASGKHTRRFRRRDEVFAYRATTEDTTVWVDRDAERWRVGDPALDAALSRHMGDSVRVLPEAATSHHDSAGLSVVGTATLAWCAARWGIDADPRRLRVNIVLDTTEPLVEETWVGGAVRLGTVELAIGERLPRCRMIDLDQDGASASGGWLGPLGSKRDLCLAVAAEVHTPGAVSVGDALTVV